MTETLTVERIEEIIVATEPDVPASVNGSKIWTKRMAVALHEALARSALAAREVEAVAWIVTASNMPTYYFESVGEAEQWSNSPGLCDTTIIPLYAHPAPADRDAVEALEGMVAAWEATKSGNTTVREIQRWLVEDMKPAIDKARAALRTLKGEQK